MAIVRVKLSGSTGGRGIAVTTGAPATLHTSTTAASTSVDFVPPAYGGTTFAATHEH